MTEKILNSLNVNDRSTQLLSGGELSVENVNVVKTEMAHLNLSKNADKTLFSHDHFSQYLQFPTVLFDGQIAPQSSVGSTLYASLVSPTLLKSTKLTRVANIASNFNQWTGSMLIRMIFTKAIFMQTKIIACFIPGGTLQDADTIDISDMYGAQYHSIMNPDNDNELSFEIPFISGKNYHNMLESTGLFIVKLFQPLVSSQPTGTTNSSIPFTLLLSSPANSQTPLTYRYLVAPTYKNSNNDSIQLQDLATQLSPQVNNNINSYDNFSTLRDSPRNDANRYKTMAFLPTQVNIPSNTGATRSTDIISAIYGNQNLPDQRQPNLNCRNLTSTHEYVSLNGVVKQTVTQQGNSKSSVFCLQELSDSTGVFKSMTAFPGLANNPSVNTLINYFVNSNKSFNNITYANTLFVKKLQDTTSTQASGPICFGAIVGNLPLGITVGDYKLPIRFTLRLLIERSKDGSVNQPFGLFNDREWNFNCYTNSADHRIYVRQTGYGTYVILGVCFIGPESGNNGFVCNAVKFIGSSDSISNYSDLPNTIQDTRQSNLVFGPTSPPLYTYENLFSNPNLIAEYEMVTKKYRDELGSKNDYSHIVAYSTLNAAQTRKCIEEGNFSNFDLIDNNFKTSAFDARFISELNNNQRLNFIALYYAFKKGVNIVGKVVKFVEGALTFVEQFLPADTDPGLRAIDDKFLIIPLDDSSPVYFTVDSNESLSRYTGNVVEGTVGSLFTAAAPNINYSAFPVLTFPS